MKPPDEVTMTLVSSPSVVRRGGPNRRMGLQHSAFCVDALAVMGIAPTTELVKEPPVGGEVTKVGCAAQQERICDGPLQMPMWPLDRTILMCDAAVVAARHHGIMGAQSFVALRPVSARVAFKIAERGRQTVTAMLAWGTTQCPKGILQSFGQSHKALAP